MAKIIDGKKIADRIRQNLKRKINRSKIKPGLAAILVGADPASEIYVGLKEKASAEVGIYFEKYVFPKVTKQATIVRKIKALNQDKKIHAILVQLPLPAHLNENRIIATINPQKDADGFHPKNLELFFKDKAEIDPGLLVGIVKLLESTKKPLKKKRAHILAKSPIFVKPLKKLLQEKGLKVFSSKVIKDTKKADILIVALGKSHIVQPKHVKRGVVIIDVGFNRIKGKIRGDVAPQVKKKASFYTPVPGGVGPMTVAMLLENTYRLAQKK